MLHLQKKTNKQQQQQKRKQHENDKHITFRHSPLNISDPPPPLPSRNPSSYYPPPPTPWLRIPHCCLKTVQEKICFPWATVINHNKCFKMNKQFLFTTVDHLHLACMFFTTGLLRSTILRYYYANSFFITLLTPRVLFFQRSYSWSSHLTPCCLLYKERHSPYTYFISYV